jgi:hypothetical protein
MCAHSRRYALSCRGARLPNRAPENGCSGAGSSAPGRACPGPDRPTTAASRRCRERHLPSSRQNHAELARPATAEPAARTPETKKKGNGAPPSPAITECYISVTERRFRQPGRNGQGGGAWLKQETGRKPGHAASALVEHGNPGSGKATGKPGRRTPDSAVEKDRISIRNRTRKIPRTKYLPHSAAERNPSWKS